MEELRPQSLLKSAPLKDYVLESEQTLFVTICGFILWEYPHEYVCKLEFIFKRISLILN